MVLAGRAEAMEKHIAQDCRHAEPDAKAEMQQVLHTKQVNGKKAKRKAAEGGELEEGTGQHHPMEAAAQMGVMPLLEVAQQQQAQHQQQQAAAAQQQAAMGERLLCCKSPRNLPDDDAPCADGKIACGRENCKCRCSVMQLQCVPCSWSMQKTGAARRRRDAARHGSSAGPPRGRCGGGGLARPWRDGWPSGRDEPCRYVPQTP